MRELSVYYCPECGYYGSFHLTGSVVCPRCEAEMNLLPIRHKDFTALNCKERDEFLSRQQTGCDSVVARLMAPHKANNSRELVAHLTSKIENLESENKKLHETVEWMHQTILDLLQRNKEIN